MKPVGPDELPAAADRQATLDRIAQLSEGAEWRFAQTMPETPHWHSLRRTWAKDADFVECVTEIRRLGYRQKFRGRWYTVLDLNDYFYWTLGWPINYPNGSPATILINRKPITQKPEAKGAA